MSVGASITYFTLTYFPIQQIFQPCFAPLLPQSGPFGTQVGMLTQDLSPGLFHPNLQAVANRRVICRELLWSGGCIRSLVEAS